GDGLARCATALAYHHNGVPGVPGAPACNAYRGMALGGGNETGIGLVLLVGTHIGEHRRAWKSDQTGEFRDSNSGWRGHGGVHLKRGYGRDVSAEASRGNRGRPPKSNPHQHSSKVNSFHGTRLATSIGARRWRLRP